MFSTGSGMMKGSGRRAAFVTAALAVLASAGGGGIAAGGAAASSSPGDQAVAYQVDTAHDGLQTDPALAPPLARRWTASLPNPPSYPLIAAGLVFVTASNAPSAGSTLYALDQADGHVVWQRSIAGSFGFSAAAYDAARVYTVDYGGLLQAFDAGTGALVWATQLPGQSAFTSPPVAAGGVVYTAGAGSGGTLYAVDETSGSLLATQPVQNGDHSSPALTGGSVFVSYACNQAYAFAQGSLDPLWHDSGGCEGGGGKTVVAAGGRVYTRDFDGNLILDAGTGALLGSFGTSTGMPAPAVDQSGLFVLTGGTLVARNLADGSTRWSFAGDGQLDSAPLVLATPSGEYVAEGSASGTLYLLDAATGAVAWSAAVGNPVPAPDEQNVAQLTGLDAGQGLLVVPAGSSLSAYAAPAPTLTSFSPAGGPVGTAVTIGGTGLTHATAVTFNGAPAAYAVVNDNQISATVPAGATSGPIAVATPGGTAASSTGFTVTTPDFSLGAAPAGRTVAIGKAAGYTVTVDPTGGFNGSVALSVSGLPAGATASFNPATTTGSSTLTVQTARNAKPVTSTLTVTGTSGAIQHTTAVTLQITKK